MKMAPRSWPAQMACTALVALLSACGSDNAASTAEGAADAGQGLDTTPLPDTRWK